MGRLALWPVQSRYPTHKNQNHRIAWHYVFGSVNSEMADFCGFQSLSITPSVEDGSNEYRAPAGHGRYATIGLGRAAAVIGDRRASLASMLAIAVWGFPPTWRETSP